LGEIYFKYSSGNPQDYYNEDGIITHNISVPYSGKADVILSRFSIDVSKINEDGTVTFTAGDYEISYMPSTDFRQLYGPSTMMKKLWNF